MDFDAVRGAAAALYVDCFPLVLTDVVRTHHPIGGECFSLVTAEASALAPGFDDQDDLMVLMSAWVDLSRGPVAVRAPATGYRFFSLTLLDAAGAPFASLGTRTRDDDGLELALVPPGWDGEQPQGQAKRTPGDLVWVVSRIRARSPLDLPEAVALAMRQTLAPLRPARAPPAASVSLSSPPCPTSVRRAMGVTPAIFFHRLDAILARAPADRQRRLRPRIAALRAELGGPPRSADWSAEFAAALASGFADGVQRIRAAAAPGGAGWRELGGGRPSPDVESLASAADALERLGAPLRGDVMSLVCDRDVDGLPLTGDETYRLRFPSGGAPPVQAFWRLAAAPPAPGQPRHADGGLEPAPNPDGSLDLVLQRAPPDAGPARNWLPLPDGRFSLLMRLFAPTDAALGGAWRMPAPEPIPAGAPAAWPRIVAASG